MSLPPLPETRWLAHGIIDGKRVELRGWHESDLDDWLARVNKAFAELTADRDSWMDQASARAQETVEAMQQVEAYRLRCDALHSTPREPLTDEQAKQLWVEATGQKLPNMGPSIGQLLAITRAIERAIASQPVAQRKPLTDEQIDALPWGPHEGKIMTFSEGLRDFARAIERAHGILEHQ